MDCYCLLNTFKMPEIKLYYWLNHQGHKIIQNVYVHLLLSYIQYSTKMNLSKIKNSLF